MLKDRPSLWKEFCLKDIGLGFGGLPQLLPFYSRERPDIALSHGARSQLLLSNVLGKPTILISDYEFRKHLCYSNHGGRSFRIHCRLKDSYRRTTGSQIRRYQGRVYAPDFTPDQACSVNWVLGNGHIRTVAHR